MKNLRVPFISVAIVLFFFSCKKNDVQAPVNTTSATTNTAKINVDSSLNLKTSSAWTTVSNWQVANQQSFSLYYASINDAAISNAVATSGLVLVYKKSSDGTVVRLPFEQKSGSQLLNYWYYQVSNGKVLITRDSYNKSDASTSDTFKYVIFSADQLNKLSQQGFDRSKLMSIGYTDVVKL